MKAIGKSIGIVVEIHSTDFQFLEQAAGAMGTDIEDFAALAIYRQSRATIKEMGVHIPLADLEANDGHERFVSRTSA